MIMKNIILNDFIRLSSRFFMINILCRLNGIGTPEAAANVREFT